MSQPEVKHEWIVSSEDFPQLNGRADRDLAARFNLSRNQIQKWIEEGHCLCNGETFSSSRALNVGDHIQLSIPDSKPLELVPIDLALEILFEDEHLIVVNKPTRMSVHPSETEKDPTIVHGLLHLIRDLPGIGGALRPGIVHRLDKNTSGALVVAKTQEAHQALVEMFSEHRLERSYWALCYGEVSFKERKVESLIGRNPSDRKKMSDHVKGGKLAKTFFKRLATYSIRPDAQAFASWMEARLQTGRTHQVRVHLTSLGHSIIGDPIYGVPNERQSKWTQLPERIRELASALPGQALHARVLGFRHPVTQQDLRFEAPPPAEFKTLWEELQKCL